MRAAFLTLARAWARRACLPACRIWGFWGSWRGAPPEADRAGETVGARTAGRVRGGWADDDRARAVPGGRWALGGHGRRVGAAPGRTGRGGAGIKGRERVRGSGTWRHRRGRQILIGRALMATRVGFWAESRQLSWPSSRPVRLLVQYDCRSCARSILLLPVFNSITGYSTVDCTPRVLPFVPGKKYWYSTSVRRSRGASKFQIHL